MGGLSLSCLSDVFAASTDNCCAVRALSLQVFPFRFTLVLAFFFLFLFICQLPPSFFFSLRVHVLSKKAREEKR